MEVNTDRLMDKINKYDTFIFYVSICGLICPFICLLTLFKYFKEDAKNTWPYYLCTNDTFKKTKSILHRNDILAVMMFMIWGSICCSFGANGGIGFIFLIIFMFQAHLPHVVLEEKQQQKILNSTNCA